MQSKQFKFLKLESNDKRSSWAQGRLELTIPRIRDRSLCLLRYKTLTRERLKKYSGLFYFICTSLTYQDYKGTSINDVPCFLVIFSLPTYLVLLYNVRFGGLSWTPLSTLISDVINGCSRVKLTLVHKHKMTRQSVTKEFN